MHGWVRYARCGQNKQPMEGQVNKPDTKLEPTRRLESEAATAQPDQPFSVVRLGTFYKCQCPAEWLEGKNALDMMLRLRELSTEAGFTVIGEHHDLYGQTRIEMLKNGWTINLTFAQSGASFDAWHHWHTVDINVHWCHEEGDLSSRSPNHEIEERFLWLVERLFQPKLALYDKRRYRVLKLPDAEFERLLALAATQ